MKSDEKVINIKKGTSYLSEVIKELPSGCILNKGITGCGGTTVEIDSKRNSIILVPTKNLVLNKVKQKNIFGVTGDVKEKEILEYLEKTKIKKIIATYDALSKLIYIIGPKIYLDYFLLIDEYHILFNSYSFRRRPIRYILNNYAKFDKFCFMTATPLKGKKLLEELYHLPIISYDWEGANKVDITIKDCAFIQKELVQEIYKAKDYNLHIFVNSVNFIKRVVKQLDNGIDYRVICSEKAAETMTSINVQSINSEVRNINFYTSTAFEGCDIYDEKGMSIIVSDSDISTTILDITTLVIQICGRLRNSIYKDKLLMLLNTRKHRYCGNSKEEFLEKVAENKLLGSNTEKMFNEEDDWFRIKELRAYTESKFGSFYIIKENEKLIFDNNLMNIDLENYDIINSIYETNISVLNEVVRTDKFNVEESSIKKLDDISIEILKATDIMKEYTYDELVMLITPILENRNIKINITTVGKAVSSIMSKKRKTTNGKKQMTYKLNLR